MHTMLYGGGGDGGVDTGHGGILHSFILFLFLCEQFIGQVWTGIMFS